MQKTKLKLKKIGNSRGFVIPKELLQACNFGDYATIRVIHTPKTVDATGNVLEYQAALEIKPISEEEYHGGR